MEDGETASSNTGGGGGRGLRAAARALSPGDGTGGPAARQTALPQEIFFKKKFLEWLVV